MVSNLGNLAATASLNIDPFQQSARVLETQTRSINRALEASELAWKNNSKNINAQKSQYELTGKAIQVHTAQLDKQKQKHEALKKEIGDVNTATAQQKTDLLASEAAMNKTSIEIDKLTNKHKLLAREIAINESNWTKNGKALEDFGNKTTKIGDGLSNFGSKWTKGVTMPIVGGVTAVTAAAISWESSFASVLKTNDEIIDKNGKVIYSYQDLEDGLRSLAKTLPSTHGEIAATAEAAGQLGIQTENVVGFTKTMIDLGESTNLSAEVAATSLAKLANITGMSQTDFDKLGSSIVDLGNNFSTTEADISAMALRLAGAGSQVGMSEADILGLSAALSSVGIEAEMGGSAISKTLVNMQVASKTGFDQVKKLEEATGMTRRELELMANLDGSGFKEIAASMGMTTTELNKIIKAGKNLEGFSAIAGMTGEQFKQAFEQDAVGALGKFIEGLGNAETKGQSAIELLDEMGISEVRLRDSLLRAGNASDLFAEAVDRSNVAWEENTALTDEAEKRYATTESQLKMLKNEVVDVAIEFGGPFVQALRDGLQVAKPFIETLSDMATAFSNANPETQQAIVKYIGLAAAIGPASKVLGGFLKITGGGISTAGKMAQTIGKLSGTAKASKVGFDLATVGMTGLGTGATAAAGTGATGLAGLAAGLGAIAVPAGIALGAIGLVTGAVIVGKKVYEDNQLAGERWGTSVTKEQDKVIKKSLELRDNATAHVNAFTDGVTDSADKVVEANQAIVDAIQSTIDKEYERATKQAENIQNEEIAAALKNQAELEKRIGEQTVKDAQERVNRINGIMKNASENNRNLSTEERAYIAENYRQLSAEQLEIAGFTAEQIVGIETAYQTDLSKLTQKQAQERFEVIREGLEKEQKSYDEQREIIIEGTKNNVSKQKELLAELESDHKKNTESMILGYAKLLEEQGYSIEGASTLWKHHGWTVEEVNKLIASSTSDATKDLTMFASGITDADMKWNSLALDPKTGEIRTNMADVLADMAKSDDGWRELVFIAKTADLTTNAVEEIAIAIGEQNKWSNLSFAEKQVLVNNDDAMLQLYESINELGMWNQYNSDRKLLGADNADFMYKTFESMGALGDYNKMSPNLKKLIAEGPAKMKINEAEQALKEFNKLPPDKKKMLGDNSSVRSQIRAAQDVINSYNRNTHPSEKKIIASTNAWSVASNAQSAMDSVRNVYRQIKIEQIMYGEGSPYRATGDPFFQGGPVVLGDGGKAEPFLTPSGKFGISPATDTMYHLERGTKIWPSIAKMMETLPHYKNGTQFDDTNLSRFAFNQPQNNQQQTVKTVQNFFQFDKLIWQGKEDIRKTVEEIGWMTSMEGRGLA